MVDRIDMEYKIEVLSGNARTTSVYPGAVDTLEEGNCVQITGTGWDVAAAENSTGGIVIRGHVDDKSVKAINKPIVLLGEATIRVAASLSGTPGALAVGGEVAMTATGIEAVAAAGVNVWGIVLEIGPAAAWFVIDVK